MPERAASRRAATRVVLALPLFAGASLAGGAVDFDRDVRPVFEARCVECHGERRPKNEFRLDDGAAALRGGISGPSILPGDADGSMLMRLVRGEDPDIPIMPPEGKPLSPEEIEKIGAWIDAGAEWPGVVPPSEPAAGHDPSGDPEADAPEAESDRTESDHWAFRAPVRPEPPSVARTDWPRNDADRFVLARLESEGLSPSPEADRATLIRRLHLDLVGLPPTPAEVDAFVADDSPGAYEALVDRLLDSPRFGERWGRRWLDLARYADTNGYEKDRDRQIWAYRDWTIRAFNEDLPYDRFVVNQIAGDMLPSATRDEKIATGFHRNTMLNEEGGIDVEQFRWESIVDRVGTTATAFLGLTVACAQCHDHKYDPISHREYWNLFAYLNNADEPDLPIPTRRDSAERERALAALERRVAELPDLFPTHSERMEWTRLSPTSYSADGTVLARRDDDSLLAVATSPDKTRYVVEFEADFDAIDAVRIETLTDDSLPKKGPGRSADGNFVLAELTATIAPAFLPEAERKLSFASAEADVEQKDYPVRNAIDGDPKTGWAIAPPNGGPMNRDRSATFRLAETLPAQGRGRLRIELDQSHGGRHAIGRFRVSTGKIVREHWRPELAKAEQRRLHLAEARAEWLAEKEPLARVWTPLAPVAARSERGATLTTLDDASVLAHGDKPNKDTYYVEVAPSGPVTGIRIEALTHDTLPLGGPGRGDLINAGNFMLNELKVEIADANSSPLGVDPILATDAFAEKADDPARRLVELATATANYAHENHPPARAMDGVRDTGWTIQGASGESHAIVFELKEPLVLAPGERLRLTMLQNFIHQETLGRFRVSTTSGPPPIRATGLDAEAEAALAKPPELRDAKETATVLRAHLLAAPELKKEAKSIADSRRAIPPLPHTLVLEERAAPRRTRIHTRGEFMRPGADASPGTPAVLPPPPPGPPDRLTFARWIASPDNPLTARVEANRVWQAMFGRGLVKTPEDFGLRSEPPSHPDLLDWLATEFVARGWSRKELIRLVANSATYRQSSAGSPELRARDPENLLLARGPRFRVEGEVVRDVALAAAGLLSAKMYGPPVKPPQPPGVSELSYGSPRWTASAGEDRYRRGVYTYMKRTSPYPSFVAFDAPTGDRACPRRERSNTPLQSLTLMNDEAFVEAAQALARRIVRESPGGDRERGRLAFRLCLARKPTSAELDRIVAFKRAQKARFAEERRAATFRRAMAEEVGAATDAPPPEVPASPVDPAAVAFLDPKNPPAEAAGLDVDELAAWTIAARALLNLDETTTRE